MKPERILLKIEPFVVCLDTSLNSVVETVNYLYDDYDFLTESPSLFVDFYIRIDRPNLFRRYLKPQVGFYVDGKTPFGALPSSQAYPFFEWGLNWVVATHVHYYLLVHAAVVEKNGQALILCGKPGAGKSTLCAALANRGWRLFSDEMAIVDLDTGELIPFVRPISLKNNSIDLMRSFAPEALFGQSFTDTAKGTVAHMKPLQDSVWQAKARAFCSWIVFPQYKQGADALSKPLPKGQTVIELAKNSFNYNVVGGEGFKGLCALVERSDCYEFEYGSLDDAVYFFASL